MATRFVQNYINQMLTEQEKDEKHTVDRVGDGYGDPHDGYRGERRVTHLDRKVRVPRAEQPMDMAVHNFRAGQSHRAERNMANDPFKMYPAPGDKDHGTKVADLYKRRGRYQREKDAGRGYQDYLQKVKKRDESKKLTEQIEQANESFLDSPLNFAQGPYIKKKSDKMHSVGGTRKPSTFTGMGRRSSLPYTHMPNIMSKPEGRELSQKVNNHFNEIRGYIGAISGGKANEFQDHVHDGVFSGHDNDTIINNHGPLNNHGMKTDSDDYTDDVHNYIDAVRAHHEYKTDVRDDSEKFYTGE